MNCVSDVFDEISLILGSGNLWLLELQPVTWLEEFSHTSDSSRQQQLGHIPPAIYIRTIASIL